MKSFKRAKGFSLIEVTIVLVLIGAIIAASASYMKAKANSDSIDNLIVTQATEMSMIVNAIVKQSVTDKASWPKDTLLGGQGATIQYYIDRGLLPANFANRNGAVGTTPLFEQYVWRVWVSSADNGMRIVVEDYGTPDIGRLQRYGLSQSAVDVGALKQKIAQKVQSLNQVPSGFINANTMVVNGNYGSFTKDNSGVYGANSIYGDVAQLYGFPDLGGPGTTNGGGGGGGGGTPPPGSKYKYCDMYAPSLQGPYYDQYMQNTACPTGWTQVAQVPYCGQNGNVYPMYQVYGSDVGDLVVGDRYTTGTVVYRNGMEPCSNIAGGSGPNCTYQTNPNNPYYLGYAEDVYQQFTTTNDDTVILLNGAEIHTDLQCFWTFYVERYDASSSQYFTNQYATSQLYVISQEQHYAYSHTYPPPLYDNLCCLPN